MPPFPRHGLMVVMMGCVCVCGEGGAHVWLRQSWGEGTRVRKWPGSGCVSDANRADVTAHIIWW